MQKQLSIFKNNSIQRILHSRNLIKLLTLFISYLESHESVHHHDKDKDENKEEEEDKSSSLLTTSDRSIISCSIPSIHHDNIMFRNGVHNITWLSNNLNRRLNNSHGRLNNLNSRLLLDIGNLWASIHLYSGIRESLEALVDLIIGVLAKTLLLLGELLLLLGELLLLLLLREALVNFRSRRSVSGIIGKIEVLLNAGSSGKGIGILARMGVDVDELVVEDGLGVGIVEIVNVGVHLEEMVGQK